MVKPAGEVLAERLLSWTGVSRHPHRFGGSEFVVNGKEIGHVHGDQLVDMPFSKKLRDQLVAERRASPHHMYPDSGWVSFYLHKQDDVERAVELLRLNYERLTAEKQTDAARAETDTDSV